MEARPSVKLGDRYLQSITRLRALPYHRWYGTLGVWAALLAANLLLIEGGYEPGTHAYFPVSVVWGPRIVTSGLLYGLVYGVLLFSAFAGAKSISGAPAALLLATLLLILGNLSQGGFDLAFRRPFYGGSYQYYHDAVKVLDWRSWLADFGTLQPDLLRHSRTHPPFAVLIHVPILMLGDHHLGWLGLTFSCIALMTLPMVYRILRWLDWDEGRAAWGMLLLAVIPAFNVYSIVCLDGVIAATSTLFLLGLVRVWSRRLDLLGVLLMAIGLMLTNLLTFTIHS